MKRSKLTSENLKQELWDVLLKLKNKKIQPIVANAIAKQSREIMTVVRAEMAIAVANGSKPNKNLIGASKEES